MIYTPPAHTGQFFAIPSICLTEGSQGSYFSIRVFDKAGPTADGGTGEVAAKKLQLNAVCLSTWSR